MLKSYQCCTVKGVIMKKRFLEVFFYHVFHLLRGIIWPSPLLIRFENKTSAREEHYQSTEEFIDSTIETFGSIALSSSTGSGVDHLQYVVVVVQMEVARESYILEARVDDHLICPDGVIFTTNLYIIIRYTKVRFNCQFFAFGLPNQCQLDFFLPQFYNNHQCQGLYLSSCHGKCKNTFKGCKGRQGSKFFDKFRLDDSVTFVFGARRSVNYSYIFLFISGNLSELLFRALLI